MVVRTPGRRLWEVNLALRAGSFIAFCMLASSIWFLHGRVKQLEQPHNPHYMPNHCGDCHMRIKDHESPTDCYTCHDFLSRSLLSGAREGLKKRAPNGDCLHDLRVMDSHNGERPVTALCISCHQKVTGYVAMVDIATKKYVEVDMSSTHPIGLMPTEEIYPRTLPLSKETGAINCITCHDQHATDKRLRMLRYYYPGNGHPADFRPLCLDCHPSGWLPLKLKPSAVREAKLR